jgi:CBS domain-containing protein
MRALESGITAANTFRRLEKAVAAGEMNENDASSLRDALILINRVRLNFQAEQMTAGEQPGNFVPTEELSPLMRRNLKAAFMLVVEAQNALSSRYQLH